MSTETVDTLNLSRIGMSQTIGINGIHDLGGVDLRNEAGSNPELIAKIDQSAKPNSYWESSIHALLVVLATKKPVPLATTDENRRCVEGLEPQAHKDWGYYDMWAVSLTTLLLERGVITNEEIDTELNGDSVPMVEEAEPIYKVGDVLRVKSEDSRLRWRRPHIRCPGYIYGQTAIVEEYVGLFKDPFLLAFRSEGPKQHLYRVSFDMASLWENTGAAKNHEASVSGSDRIQADIYEGWLEKIPDTPACDAQSGHDHQHTSSCSHNAADEKTTHDHDHSHAHGHSHSEAHEHSHEHAHEHVHHEAHSEASDHDHAHAHAHTHADTEVAHVHCAQAHQEQGHHAQHVDHDGHPTGDHTAHDAGHTHDHGHTHEGRFEVECTAADREGADSNRPGKVVGEALLRLLYRKNIVTPAEIHRTIESLEMAGVNMRAADLVVYAWKDPAFKERLIKDAPSAALEYGIPTSNQNAPTVLRVVANTPTLHNVIVCTLCSCYPLGLLGFSPAWYKSRAYRSRVVREPRKVLQEFGLTLPDGVAVRVHDSTADCRYFVLPLPPSHLTPEDIKSMSHAELKALVTRDSMIGVAVL